MSAYKLQVIEARTGLVVHGWQPGDKVETDLAEELCSRLQVKGVGLFKSEAKVLGAVKEAMSEMIFELKRRV